MPDYEKAAERAARKYKVDPRIFKAMIRQESGFRQGLTSPKGAQGIAQFIPSTAKAYGVNLHDNRATDDLEGAARYLRDNLKRTGGNYHRALSIYNSGRPEGYKHIAETSEYVQRILKGSKGERTTERGGSPSSSPTSKTVTKSRTIPGVDRSDERRQVILRFLQERHRPGAVADLATGLRDTKDTPSVRATSSRTVRTKASSSSKGTSHGGTADFEGHNVASWIKPLLTYARARGWKGQVTSGYRTDAEQVRIYNSGTRPAAKPKALGGGGSKHSETGFLHGAIDVTDAATLDRILKAKHSRLKFAGAKDPVHFSVPSGGTY